MDRSYYSQRLGKNREFESFSLSKLLVLFSKMYAQLEKDGYFTEAFGYYCVDYGIVEGSIKDIEFEILLVIRKENLWPIKEVSKSYSEEDLFDIIEFLFQHVSKPIKGNYHSYNDCGMHWETFDKFEGQREFRNKINKILDLYKEKFELTKNGEIVRKSEEGFENIFEADIPSTDITVLERMNGAIVKYRRHNSSIDDRRHAVRDLIDILELLKPQMKTHFSNKDESDLFNIANNFGLRHLNDVQKLNYDANLWLSWLFYFYLATVHLLLRKIDKDQVII